MVTGHLHLFYPQVEIVLETEGHYYPEDPRKLGIQVFKVESNAFRGVVQYLDGFFGIENNSLGVPFRWSR